MKKRNLFAEIAEGFDALANERAGKQTLRMHKVDIQLSPEVTDNSSLTPFLSTASVAFIIGGEQIYTQAMALADHLQITEVDLEPEGDAWFPEIAAVDWEKTAKTEGNGFAFVTYSRRVA